MLCDAPCLSDPNAERACTLFDQPNTTIPYAEHPTEHGARWHPFSSPTAALLTTWHYTGSSLKSSTDTNRLVHDFISHDLFKAEEAYLFDIVLETQRVDRFLEECAKSYPHTGDWVESSVKIRVPCEKRRFCSEAQAPEFEISGVHYQ